MRTMLISLVLFCSLTQLAIVDGALGPKFGVHDNLKDCGADRIYHCYVPVRCTVEAMKDNPISVASIKEVKADDKIFDDCQAIIRFHQYGSFRVHVSIESLQDTTKIKKIVFSHMTEYLDGPKKKARTTFSCELTNDKHVAKYLTAVQSNLEKTSDKLKCTFVAKKSKLSDTDETSMFYGTQRDRISIIAGTSSQIIEYSALKYDNPRCEPEYFKYNFEQSESKRYKAVQVDASMPEKYDCPEKYKMEVVRDVNAGYEEINGEKIECKSGAFKINGKEFGSDDEIQIRCVADVDFFCEYNVKTLNDSEVSATKRQPKRTYPDFKNAIKTALECDNEYPHLIIVRTTETAVLNANIKCVNYVGRDPVFTIVNGTKISAAGPKVYCTNKLECHVLNKISESSVVAGTLDQLTFQPICYERGTLKEMDTKKIVNRTRCDGRTGRFEYFLDKETEPKLIEKYTKFICVYAPVADTKRDQKNRDTIAIGSAVGIGISVVVAIGLIVAAGYFASLRVKKENARIKQRERENKAAWKKYCWDKEEKAAYNEANDLDSEQSAEAPSELSNWSPMLMSFQYRAMAHMMNDAGTKLTHNQHEREKHKFEFEKTPENVLKCAQIYKCMVPGEDTGKDTPERRMHETYSVPKAAKWWTNEKVFNKRKRRFDNIFAL